MLVIKSAIHVFEILQIFQTLSRLPRLLSCLVVKVDFDQIVSIFYIFLVGRQNWLSRLVFKVVKFVVIASPCTSCVSLFLIFFAVFRVHHLFLNKVQNKYDRHNKKL